MTISKKDWEDALAETEKDLEKGYENLRMLNLVIACQEEQKRFLETKLK